MTTVTANDSEQAVLKQTEDSMKRDLSGVVGSVVRWLAISASLYHIYALSLSATSVIQLRAIHLLVGLLLVPLIYQGSRRPFFAKLNIIDLILAGLSVAATVYVLAIGEDWVWRAGVNPTVSDIIFGAILVLAVFEVTRRVIGWPMIIIALVFWVYAMTAGSMPGILMNRSYSMERIISQVFSMEGIYGTAIGASSTFVFLFVLLGAVLKVSRAGDFFIDVSYSLAGRFRGGPAKVAIFGSALFGTISGSGIANVAAVGTLTIPLMKKAGFKPTFAGAVEAAASTGGQIMPPIMGAAAFLMAEMINIPYGQIALAAMLPAVLYFFGLFMVIDFESAKQGLKGLSADELPKIKVVFKQWGHLTIPFLVLLYVLLVEQATPIRAAFITMVVTLIISWVRPQTRMKWTQITKSLQDGATGCLEVIAGCACAGIIVALVSLTGVGIKLSSGIVVLSGGNLAVALVLTMLVVLVLSMGLPTTPAYIIAATVIGPVLIKLGATPLSANLFIFYFACMSAITPPVALVAYPAAAIAGANPIKVGFTAWKMALTAFIIPYIFVFSPALLLKGTVGEILLATVSSLIGVSMLAGSLQGWFLRTIGWISRVILFVGAILLIVPGLTTDIIGSVCLIVVLLINGIRGSNHEAKVSPDKG